jgi:hypothetical protein
MPSEGLIRKNAGVALNEYVMIKKAEVKEPRVSSSLQAICV